MTLPSRHMIRNSNPRGLRPSTLSLCHGCSQQYWVLREDGEETFMFLSNCWDRKRPPNSSVKVSGANHYSSAPAHPTNDPVLNWSCFCKPPGPTCEYRQDKHNTLTISLFNVRCFKWKLEIDAILDIYTPPIKHKAVISKLEYEAVRG